MTTHEEYPDIRKINYTGGPVEWAVLGTLFLLAFLPVIKPKLSDLQWFPMPQPPQPSDQPFILRQSAQQPPTVLEMQQLLMSEGVCESRARAFTASEVTPLIINEMKTDCRRENGRKQLVIIAAGAVAIISGALMVAHLSQRHPRQDRTIPFEVKQIPFSLASNYPRWSRGVKKFIQSHKMREVRDLWK